MDTTIDALFNGYLKKDYSDSMKQKATNLFKTTEYSMKELTSKLRIRMADHLCGKSKEGYIYCIHNKMYNYYGPNFYKLGRTYHLSKRLNGYQMYGPEKTEYKATSKKIKNSTVGESLLFKLLKSHKYKPNREFFNCELTKIKETIVQVEEIFKKKTVTEIMMEYFPERIRKNMVILKKYLLNVLPKDIQKELPIYRKISGTNQKTKKTVNCGERHTRDELLHPKTEGVADYMKLWNIKKIDNNFLDDNYGKTETMVKLNYLLDIDTAKVDMYCKYRKMKETTNKYCQNIKRKSEIIIDVIEKIGYTDLTNSELIAREDFIKGMDYVVNKSKLYSDKVSNCKLFGLPIKEQHTVKAFLGFFNRILKEFGLVIKRKRKNKRVNKKHITIDSYNIQYISNINEYM